jgi:6-carboxyhexanoate--CoA ligase
VGTLSKALGSEGGFVCGTQTLIDYLRNRSRPFIFSTAPGAPAVSAANAALSILEEERERVAQLRKNVEFFIAALAQQGIAVQTQSAIVPIRIGDERRAVAVAEELLRRGFLIPAIRYPTVARGAARLRVALMSTHTPETLRQAAAALADALRTS